MTVDELTKQTLYRREDWQRVYEHLGARDMLSWWDELADQCARNGLSPGMAHTMISMVPVPPLTAEDFEAFAEHSRAQRRQLLKDYPSLRVWPWVILAFVLLFAGTVFFWLALR